MSYIGQNLPTDVFGGYTTDTFAGDGSATTFTLSQAPFNEQGLIVVINNVIQQPTTNYTVSGTTLTIVGTAVASGDVIYARHTGVALPIGEANALDLQGQSDKLILDADADTTISADTDDQIDFKVGGTDVVTLTNSSLALKGTTPTLTIGDAGAEDTKIVFDGNAQDFYVGLDDSADDLIIGLGSTVGTTPIISVDENKDVSIPDGGLTITTSDNTDQLTLVSTDADGTVGPRLRLFRDSGSPVDNDIIGDIRWEGKDSGGNDFMYANQKVTIHQEADGSEQSMMQFYVALGGSSINVLTLDRASATFNEDSNDIDFRVESNGEENCLFVSGSGDKVQTGRNSDSGVTETGIDFFNFGQMNIFRAANSLRFAIIFNNTDSSAAIGSITMQSSATAFNTSSDYRLKENVDYDWDATTRLKQLKPARFNWISDDTNTLLEGFMAHEVTSIVPQAVAGEKDQVATAEDVTAGLAKQVGDPVYQGIDQSKLVPLMVKTIQELEARIKTLEDA